MLTDAGVRVIEPPSALHRRSIARGTLEVVEGARYGDLGAAPSAPEGPVGVHGPGRSDDEGGQDLVDRLARALADDAASYPRRWDR